VSLVGEVLCERDEVRSSVVAARARQEEDRSSATTRRSATRRHSIGRQVDGRCDVGGVVERESALTDPCHS
jgi:hypothetical protein